MSHPSNSSTLLFLASLSLSLLGCPSEDVTVAVDTGTGTAAETGDGDGDPAGDGDGDFTGDGDGDPGDGDGDPGDGDGDPGDGDGDSGDGDGDPGDGDGDPGDGDGDGDPGDGDGDPGDGDGDPGDGDGDPGDGDGDNNNVPLPNIDMIAAKQDVQDSMWTMTTEFAEDDCAIAEECVGGPGERRLLRFSTITPNLGEADFVVGSPDLNPEMFEWGECHGHWHFSDFAAYRLIDFDDNVVAVGHKMAFALIDLSPFTEDAGPAQYPMPDGTQGISVGWADIYSSQLDCQWIDITGVPSGIYILEITINPEEQVLESNHLDNVLLLPVVLTDEDDGPSGPPEEWTCAPGFYGSDDGCDCGCGVLDPDCANPTSEACGFCNDPGSCAEGLMGCDMIMPNNNAICQ